MKCPYCQSVVADEVLACPHCTKDLYLFRPMIEKVAELELQLGSIPERQALLERIGNLESLLAEQASEANRKPKVFVSLKALLVFIVLPLLVLLLGHGLITFVYDTKLLYLRLLSLGVPALFGYILMNTAPRKLAPWIIISTFMAMIAVLGMSYTTHLVDGTPVLPRNSFEWREFFEYGVSISSSFWAGMILGRASYIKHQGVMRHLVNSAYFSIAASAGTGNLDAAGAIKLMKIFNDHISTITALGSTILSVYTGLKAIFG